jgi:HAE1 family hydrophobic/amphiphilic exporter-1
MRGSCAGLSRSAQSFVTVGFGCGICFMNNHLPSGFIPLEDQGMIGGIIQTPPGSTIECTSANSHELQEIA